MSVSVFDEHRELWRQTWVDDVGNYFALEGNLVDGEMVLQCEEHSRPERDAVYRMRFADIEPNSLPGDIVVLHDGRPANEPPELSWPTREATVDAVALILEEMSPRAGCER
jgi:hypothetical protein